MSIIIIVLIGVFAYLILGAFIAYMIDEDTPEFILFWPIILFVLAAMRIGEFIGEQIETLIDTIKKKEDK